MVPLSPYITVALASLMISAVAALMLHSRQSWRARLDDTTCHHEEATYSYTTGVARCVSCGHITEQDT